MKSIAIVTDSIIKNQRRNKVGQILKDNLKEIFSDSITINNYYIDQLSEDSMIEDDLVLAMTNSRAIRIRKYVSYPENIIVVKRTFLKSNITELFTLPDKSQVLVVNDDIETILDSVSSLYAIGVQHLDLVPYDPDHDFSHIDIAVSPSEPEFIPKHISNFIDLGNRVIDGSTMLLIMNMLDIDERSISLNLYKYYQKIFSTNVGIQDHYSTLLTRTEILDHLLDLSNDGILLLSEAGQVLIFNKKFKEIFDIRQDISGSLAHKVLARIDWDKYYNRSSQDELIVFNKKSISLQKQYITHYNNMGQYYFNFQEVTYIKKLEQNLNRKLRQKGQVAKYSFKDIKGQSPAILALIKKGKKIAGTDVTVLITGETGTGKEVLAQAIHNASPRQNQAFVAINCAAMPESLLESELFGYVKGAFTGALREGKKGLFEVANHGTIFLDEIGDMPYHLQAKIVRVLQEQQIMPIGSDRIINIDVRIIAASHRDLTTMMDRNLFRKDLFYRLNMFPLDLPALRARMEDFHILFKHFAKRDFEFSQEAYQVLMAHSWPGNIRELRNIASYISIIEEGNQVGLQSLPDYLVKGLTKETSQLDPSPRTNSPSFQEADKLLELRRGLAPSIKVLAAIDYLNKINRTAGRKHLLEYLDLEGPAPGESQLRTILADLASLGLIKIKDGRRGSFITEKGSLYLKSKY